MDLRCRDASCLNPPSRPPTLLKALRPFSLVVALVSSGLGVQLAWQGGYHDPLRALLVVVAALLLQAGVNLINDRADLARTQDSSIKQSIRHNSYWGWGCFALCSLIGLWLVGQSGWTLMALCLVGLLGALGYTVEPLNYKRRGLGVPLVFWLMGVLLVLGSWHAMGAPLVSSRAVAVMLLSLPISCLVALLLLSNELRDWERDRAAAVATLTVRLGYSNAARFYLLLLMLAYLSALLLWQQQLLLRVWPVMISAVLLPVLWRLLNRQPDQRQALTPATGRLLGLFGLLYMTCLL